RAALRRSAPRHAARRARPHRRRAHAVARRVRSRHQEPVVKEGTKEKVSRLTSTQRKYLRGLAHSLSPVVHVGRAGVNANVIDAARRALDDHELIKVKIAADRAERPAMAAEIEQSCDADIAGEIGTIAILYRQ